MLKSLLAKYIDSGPRTPDVIVLKHLSFENVFGFDGPYDLNLERGIVYLVGSNTCGKTSILHIILYALYGRTPSQPSIVHSGRARGFVELSYTRNGADAFVSRTFGARGGDVVRGDSLAGFIPKNDFLTYNVADNFLSLAYSKMTPAQLRESLASVNGSDKFKALFRDVKETIKRKAAELGVLQQVVRDATVDVLMENKEDLEHELAVSTACLRNHERNRDLLRRATAETQQKLAAAQRINLDTLYTEMAEERRFVMQHCPEPDLDTVESRLNLIGMATAEAPPAVDNLVTQMELLALIDGASPETAPETLATCRVFVSQYKTAYAVEMHKERAYLKQCYNHFLAVDALRDLEQQEKLALSRDSLETDLNSLRASSNALDEDIARTANQVAVFEKQVAQMAFVEANGVVAQSRLDAMVAQAHALEAEVAELQEIARNEHAILKDATETCLSLRFAEINAILADMDVGIRLTLTQGARWALIVEKQMHRLPVAFASGWEQLIINTLMQYAFLPERHYAFLFLDEQFDCIGKSNIPKIDAFLNVLNRRFKHIHVVSHHIELTGENQICLDRD